MREVLAIRDARLYLGGQALSMLGDSALLLVLGIWAKELTGSSAAAGLVILAVVAPTLLAPLTGLLADRVRRRPLLLAANLLTGLAVLPLLAVDGPEDLWLLYVVGALYGLAATVIGAGQSALLVTVVPPRLLPAANGSLQTAREGLRLVAPLVGAALFAAFGGGAVAVLDAATFALAAAAVAAMRTAEPRPAREPGGRLAAVAAGARHVARSTALRRMTGACALAFVALGLAETALFEVVGRGLQRPPAFLGVLLSAQGVGAVLGGLSASWLTARGGEAATAAAGMAAFGAGCLALTSGALALVVAGAVACGAAIPWIVVGQMTLLQRRTPGPVQGRAWAAVELLCGVPQTLAIAGGAGLVTLVDYRLVLVVMAIVLAAAATYLLAGRALTRAPVGHEVRPVG